ncbi:hypothetical protein [Winogradskyella alexanderae]|uniref:RND transporter n=1 Tax=Winogradskyella alexanderae TaxID=2877123 RepID=A0ABS7XSA6_9FLAO|nr:hypothetical protein [Winogradskyella alexanderae]MCA0132895.1 hypothetical protein [Winogradskyella alexanderae]
MKLFNDWRLIILLCLTLGLAPFFPEPHLLGKIRWVVGGAKGMQPMDYFDLLLHGFPFLLLFRLIAIQFKK